MFCSLCKQKTVNEFIWGLHQFYFTPNYAYWHELIDRALLKSYNTDVISLQTANVKPLYELVDSLTNKDCIDLFINSIKLDINLHKLDESKVYFTVKTKDYITTSQTIDGIPYTEDTGQEFMGINQGMERVLGCNTHYTIKEFIQDVVSRAVLKLVNEKFNVTEITIDTHPQFYNWANMHYVDGRWRYNNPQSF